MGKSRAEIQREYRARQKEKLGEQYYTRETERVKRYYVPAADLRPRDKEKRQEKIRAAVNKHRQLKRQQQITERRGIIVEQDIITEQHGDGEINGPCDSTTAAPSTRTRTRILVKLPSFTRRNTSTTKRVNRSVSRMKTKLEGLEKDNQKLQRRLWAAEKRITRSKSRKSTDGCTTSSNNQQPSPMAATAEPMTPDSKTKNLMRRSHLSPRKHQKLRKELNLHFAMLEEVKSSKSLNKKINPLAVVTGKILDKYRVRKLLKSRLAISQRSAYKPNEKALAQQKKQRLADTRRRQRDLVVQFFEADDNSTCLPGKKDYIKVNGEKIQRRILNDYVKNLYVKFSATHTNLAISWGRFCQYRPEHVTLASFGSRNTCLCQTHQNLALKLTVLYQLKLVTTKNPDEFIAGSDDDTAIAQKLDQIPEETEIIRFQEWKRMPRTKQNGEVKYVTKLVDSELPRGQFIVTFISDITNFRGHVQRIKAQYSAVRDLKKRLPDRQAICHMDFAQNYLCAQTDEVQSAYYDKPSVTLHPMMIYYKSGDELQHQAFVIVSDDRSHTSSSVFAFIQALMPEVKKLVPGPTCLNYITDSPTSQYRNKVMMYVVANHEELLGCKSSWLYLEAGHGKGPCDGLGGAAKRMADTDVRVKKISIQDAEDFFAWAESTNSTMKFIYVPQTKCIEAATLVGKMPTKTVKGTMKLHAVTGQVNGIIKVRDTSCYCEKCFDISGASTIFPAKCPGWREVKLASSETSLSANPMTVGEQSTTSNSAVSTRQSLFEMFDV